MFNQTIHFLRAILFIGLFSFSSIAFSAKPFIGTWNSSFPDANPAAYGTLQVLKGGEVIFGDTPGVGQLNREGSRLIGLSSVGKWKKIRKNKYRAYGVTVYVDAIDGTPLFRSKQIINATVSKNGKTYTGTITANFYSLEDTGMQNLIFSVSTVNNGAKIGW